MEREREGGRERREESEKSAPVGTTQLNHGWLLCKIKKKQRLHKTTGGLEGHSSKQTLA